MDKKAAPMTMAEIIDAIKDMLKYPKLSVAPTAIGSLGGAGVGAGVGYLNDDMSVSEGALKGLGIGAGAGAGMTAGTIGGAITGLSLAPRKKRFLDDLFTGLAYMSTGGVLGGGAGAVGGGFLGKEVGDLAAEKYAAYTEGFLEKCAQYGMDPDELFTDQQDLDGQDDNQFGQYYKEPNILGKNQWNYFGNGLGQFAGNFNDDNYNRRATLFNRAARQLQNMGQVQMAYAARGMEIPKNEQL